MDFGKYNASPPVLGDGDVLRDMQVDNRGRLLVAPSGGTGTSANQAQGTSASGVTDDGSNPVKIGGVFKTTRTAVSNGQRTDANFDAYGSQYGALCDGTGKAIVTVAPISDSYPATNVSPLLGTFSCVAYFDGSTGNMARGRGDVSGAWVHAPASSASPSLSGTIATSGGTAAIVMTNTTRSEVLNPSTATLWASWGTPAVNGSGSFPINAGGTYSPPDRAAGTLTLLSTAATQPYTVNRFS